MNPFVDLPCQQKRIRAELDAAIARVLDHGKYIMGPEIDELEHRLSDFAGGAYCGSNYCRDRRRAGDAGRSWSARICRGDLPRGCGGVGNQRHAAVPAPVCDDAVVEHGGRGGVSARQRVGQGRAAGSPGGREKSVGVNLLKPQTD